MNLGIVTTEDPDFKRDLDKFLNGVVGCIEATDCERSYVYQQCRESNRTWGETGSGMMCGIGECAGMPVTIVLWCTEINGHKILFYDSPSQVVDHRMVRSWLADNLPKTAWRDGRVNNTDATNWPNCIPYEPKKASA